MAYTNYKTLRISDNLFCYFWRGRGNNCNTYLLSGVLEGDHPHVLIDPGNSLNEYREPCAEQMLAALSDDGFKVEEIGLILITHFHSDHCSACKDIIIKNKGDNPPFVAFPHKEYEFLLESKERMRSFYGNLLDEIKPVILLDEGELKLGKISLQVFRSPGHSPGSLCFYWPDEKVLFTGDVLFFGSIGRTDLLGGDHQELGKSIDRLSTLDIEVLLPGHSTEYGSYIQDKDLIKRNFQAVQMFFQ